MLAATAERDPDHAAAEGHKQSVMVVIQLQAQNPPVLLTLNVAPKMKANVHIVELWWRLQPVTQHLLGGTVHIDVLQQLGPKAVVGMRTGQDLQDSSVV